VSNATHDTTVEAPAKPTTTVGKAAESTAPVAEKIAGDTAGQAGGLVGGAARGGELPTDALTGSSLPPGSLGGLPLGG